MVTKDNIKAIFFGNTAIRAVYLGNILLWSAGPYLHVSPEEDIWLPQVDPQAQIQIKSNTDWLIE